MIENAKWLVVVTPETEADGSLDLGGHGMVVRAPNGQHYEVITPDMVPCVPPPETTASSGGREQ